jgi:hypothetical protein
MDIQTVREFFMWCTIINAALLVFSFLMCASAGGWIYRMHSQCFPMSRETFNVAVYSFLGVYKMLFIALNLVPYLALAIVG